MRRHRGESAGRIILLSGPSSSGKSSIARELQNRIELPFWHISIDHLRDAGVIPMARIRSGEFPWQGLRDAFFAGFEQSLAAYAEAGNHLIVEHIVETDAWRRRLADVLQAFDVFFVGVHCDLAELERREKARRDRPIGDARRDFFTVHAHAEYDFEVDSAAAPGSNADRIIAAWKIRTAPSAFERIRRGGRSTQL